MRTFNVNAEKKKQSRICLFHSLSVSSTMLRLQYMFSSCLGCTRIKFCWNSYVVDRSYFVRVLEHSLFIIVVLWNFTTSIKYSFGLVSVHASKKSYFEEKHKKKVIYRNRLSATFRKSVIYWKSPSPNLCHKILLWRFHGKKYSRTQI